MDLGYAGGPVTDAGRVARPALDLMVAQDGALIEGWWKAFEGEAAGSAYQRFDWADAYLGTLGQVEGAAPRIVVGRDAGGATAFILPLVLCHRGPLRLALPVGGAHANYHAALWRRGAPLGDPRALLAAIGRLVGADAVALAAMPRSWNGEPNPLVPAGAPAAASNAYRLDLSGSGEDVLKRVLSREARKKLRQKEARLAELGPVELRQAATPEEVEAVLATFFAHKAERRRTIGLPNPFEDAPARAFLRRACLAGLDRGAPAVELYSLCAGERIVATFAGAADETRLSGMVLSFDAGDSEIARRSPGDLLVARLVAEQCRRGRKVLDLGVGEARYKSTFCDGVDEIADVLVPVTPLGHAYGLAAAARRLAKRSVKRTPWAWSLVTRLRRGTAAGRD
ncbi:GNAT family N-acetyltransferase [Salinarimonas soli]|uniref:GNAT family N-acetyltransferase n=1 Tax=Salinarimonas soli TaxID=1638099 RepID=A0A5B2VAH8_9HYPH|nr:GNAT family N-acetyltransferase [Salinarimonas soli]KAA2235605.1 GNAT family N-acetyltransferase [Salinarimonas soli]